MTEYNKELVSRYMASCDWGSSRFRLKIMDRQTRQVVCEMTTADGARLIRDQWLHSSEGPSTGRDLFYLSYLEKALRILAAPRSIPINGITVVVSGMASSSIGIRELPYNSLPFFTQGTHLIKEWIKATPPYPFDLLLLSGVQSTRDVMRGEETQLIGIFAQLPNLKTKEKNLFILPGTHCKHIVICKEKMTEFRTYMTGELFQVMSNHSILGEAIEPYRSEGPVSADLMEAFREGLVQSGQAHLLSNLFSVRINDLFRRMTKKQNKFYLSGLIIGAELRAISADWRGSLVLCSTGLLYTLYRQALEALDLLSGTFLIPPGMVELAAAHGHLEVISHER